MHVRTLLILIKYEIATWKSFFLVSNKIFTLRNTSYTKELMKFCKMWAWFINATFRKINATFCNFAKNKCNFSRNKCNKKFALVITFTLILITSTLEGSFGILFFHSTFKIVYMKWQFLRYTLRPIIFNSHPNTVRT